MKYLYFYFLLLCSPLFSQSFSPQWQWASTCNSHANPHWSGELSSDKYGNVYAVAQNTGLTTYGTYSLTQQSLLIKYNSLGTILWARGLTYKAMLMESDSVGNVYISGTFSSSINTDNSSFNTMGGRDIFLVKLNAGGIEEWARQYGNKDDNWVSDMAIDGRSNVHLTGWYQGDTMSFSGYTHITSNQWRHFYVARISSTGTTKWVTNGNPPSGTQYYDAISIQIASQEKIFVFNSGSICQSQGCSYEFLIKLDTSGTQYFSQQGPSNYYGGFSYFKLDKYDNIYTVVYGRYAGAYTKFNKDLVYRWAVPTNVTYGCWSQYLFDVDREGNSFRAGNIYYSGQNYDSCSDTTGVVWYSGQTYSINGMYLNSSDILYTSLDSAGNQTSVYTAGGYRQESFNNIHISKVGDLYYNGCFNNTYYAPPTLDTLVLGTHTLYSSGPSTQFFVAKIGNMNLTSINKRSLNLIEFYPNPVKDILTVNLNHASNGSYSISDLSGRVLKTQPIVSDQNTIELTDVQPGLYLFTLYGNNSQKTYRLFKE